MMTYFIGLILGVLLYLLTIEEYELLKSMSKEEDIIETNRKLTVESEELHILDSETME